MDYLGLYMGIIMASYYFCYEPETIQKIFEQIRNPQQWKIFDKAYEEEFIRDFAQSSLTGRNIKQTGRNKSQFGRNTHNWGPSLIPTITVFSILQAK